MGLYDVLFDQVLTKVDPEVAHERSFRALRALAAVPRLGEATRHTLTRPHPVLAREVLGHRVASPVGLAAGFDKNGEGIDALAALGFGAVEIGTVTGQPQPGNPRPRLFRLPRDRALINRMGFNNEGSAAVAERLARRADHPHGEVLLGINIGKTKVVPADEAVADYALSARRLARYADYLVVNVSSPNTPGLRDLQSVAALRPILAAVVEAAADGSPRPVPLLVKIAPDLADEDIVAVAGLVADLGIAGVVATNTTIARTGLRTDPGTVAACGEGGLSGPVLAPRARAVLALLRDQLPSGAIVVSAGGIDSAAEAHARLDAGAALVQAYTGLVYGGPAWVRDVNAGLAARALGREEGTSR